MNQEVLDALRGGRPARIPYWGDGSFVLADMPGRRPPRSGQDAWGVSWTPLPAGYVAGSDEPAESYPTGHPCTRPEEIPALPLPELAPPAPFRADGRLVIGPHPAGPLDRFVTLLGIEAAYLALARTPEACAAALRHIAEHHVRVAHALLAAGVGAGFLADDYAGQAGPMISPRQWRAVVLPAVASVLEVYRSAGAPVIFHTCGRAEAFIGELIDAGATAFNLQTDVADVHELKRRYGTRIAFYGGAPTDIMLQGSPEDVRAAVRRARETFGAEGGLVLAPDQPLAYPESNIRAFVEEAAKSAL